MMKSYSDYWSKIKEIRDKACAANTYDAYVDGVEKIQQLIDECDRELHVRDVSLIPFRHFRNELDEKAEEIARARWEARFEADMREELRRQEEREQAALNNYYSYDPFYRSPTEEKLWEDNDDDYSPYINDDGDVWGWDSMSS